MLILSLAIFKQLEVWLFQVMYFSFFSTDCVFNPDEQLIATGTSVKKGQVDGCNGVKQPLSLPKMFFLLLGFRTLGLF